MSQIEITNLTWTQYLPLAIRTASPRHPDVHGPMGLVTEVGELVDFFKKVSIYGKEADGVNFVEELGDLAWYIAFEANRLNIDLSLLSRIGYLGETGISDATVHLVTVVGNYFGAQDDYRKQNLPVIYNLFLVLADFAVSQGWAKATSDVLDVNIAKLAKRYGDKYSDTSAIVRNLDGERAVLEAGSPAPQLEAGNAAPQA